MAVAAAGYSGTPLRDKLGMRDGTAACFVALPEKLQELARLAKWSTLRLFPSLTAFREARDTARSFDFVHAFSARRSEIDDMLRPLQESILRDGMVWISWPKKASKVQTDVTEDVVRNCALKLDLVDVKVAAIDETWSGLKLVIRKDRR